MTRDEIQERILRILEQKFEFKNPGPEDRLRDDHGFDSIDALELMGEIEKITGFPLTREDKERAMEIRTVNDIVDYIVALGETRKS